MEGGMEGRRRQGWIEVVVSRVGGGIEMEGGREERRKKKEREGDKEKEKGRVEVV